MAGHGDDLRQGDTRFEVSIERDSPADVVVVRGDIDMQTAPQLQDCLDEAVRAAERAGRPAVVVDLQGVTFLGSSGLRVLAAAHDRGGPRLLLVSAHRLVRRVVELAGLTAELPVFESVHAALR